MSAKSSDVLFTAARELSGDGVTFGVVEEHFLVVSNTLQGVLLESVCSVVASLRRARDDGASVFVFGNGGSAATALHLANDLTMACAVGRPGLRVTCLSANLSLITAIANDFGYDQVFSRQLASLVRRGDVVIGISGSGNSPNCVNAFDCARRAGATCVGILGFDGGRMLAQSDVSVHVRCDDYLVVEDVHMVVAHSLARALRRG